MGISSYHTFFKFYVLNSVKFSSSQEWRRLCSSKKKKKCSQSRNGQGLTLGSLYHEFPQRMTSNYSILLYFKMLIRKVSMGVTHPGNRQWLPVCEKVIDRFSNIELALEERWKDDIFKSPRKPFSLYCNLATKGNFSNFL